MRNILLLIYLMGICFNAIDCNADALMKNQVFDGSFCEKILKEDDGYNILRILSNIKVDIGERRELVACIKKMIPQWMERKYDGGTVPALLSMIDIIYRYGDADDVSILYPLIDYHYPRPTGLRWRVYNTLGRHGDQRTLDFILAKEPELKGDPYYSFLERAKAELELRAVSLSAEEVKRQLLQNDGTGIQSLLDADDKSYLGLLDIIQQTTDPVIMKRALEVISQLSVEKHHVRETLSWRLGEVNPEIKQIILESRQDQSADR